MTKKKKNHEKIILGFSQIFNEQPAMRGRQITETMFMLSFERVNTWTCNRNINVSATGITTKCSKLIFKLILYVFTNTNYNKKNYAYLLETLLQT